MTLMLTGLDIEAKAARAETMLFDLLGGRDQFDGVDVTLVRSDHADAATNAQATAQLRVTVKDADGEKVGRRFSNAVVELSLASYAGFFTSTPPTSESAFGVYWPTLVPADAVEHAVVLPDGTCEVIAPAPNTTGDAGPGVDRGEAAPVDWGETVRAALGAVCGGRSGDKGGNANVGLWTATDDAYAWLSEYLTDGRVRALVPEAADLEVRQYRLPNLRAVNLVFVGILGEGVASSTRPDPQAKGLAEYVRSRVVDVPRVLLER
jgi:hypothetical protein